MPAKKPLGVGDRVRHKTEDERQEGVVVHVNHHRTDNPLDVHWYVESHRGPAIRGCYSPNDIEKIPPKSLKKLVEEESEKDG
jgi:hypothetical protein